MKYIFGPVKSRRFGVSLGIDLSPKIKSCNFDCLYCELNKAKKTDFIKNEADPEDILLELKDFLSKNPYPDVITITANGEPTLYTKLDTLIKQLNKIKGKSKTLILSNGSTIYREDIKEALKKLDMVKISLDAVSESIFRKIDRPLKSISIKKIIDGIKNFRKIYNGELIIEILVVKDINDTDTEMKKIASVLKKIKPDRVDIGTVDRPPAYNVKPVDDRKLEELSKYFEGLNVLIARRNIDTQKKFSLIEDEIIRTLQIRPMPEEDMINIFDNNTLNLIKVLKSKGILKEKKVGNIKFIYAN